MLKRVEALIIELMQAEKKELLIFMLLIEDVILGATNSYIDINEKISEKMKNWSSVFYGINKEKQLAVYGALMILVGFMDYRGAEIYLEQAAEKDIEVNNLLNLLFECYTQ